MEEGEYFFALIYIPVNNLCLNKSFGITTQLGNDSWYKSGSAHVKQSF